MDHEINTNGGFINNVLKFDKSTYPGVTETGGENAVFTINGLETQRNSNAFDINGVTFTLKKEFLETTSRTSHQYRYQQRLKRHLRKYQRLYRKI